MKKIKDNMIFLCIAAVIFCSMFSNLVNSYFDNDFYHIAVSGRDIVQNGIQHTNIHFVLDGYDTVIQQWLYAVLLYKFWEFGGYIGVFFFTLLNAVFLFSVFYRYLRIREVEKHSAICAAFFSMAIFTHFNLRPEIITIALLILEMIGLEQYRLTEKVRYLYLIPLTVLAEINLHAACWAFHFVVLLPYITPMPEILRKFFHLSDDRISIRSFGIPIALSLLALFTSPYGLDNIMLLFNSGNVGIVNVTENQQTTILNVYSAYIVLCFAVFTVGIKFCILRNSSFFYTVGFSLLSLLAVRNIIFINIVIIVLFGDFLSHIRVWHKINAGGQKEKVLILITSILACIFIWKNTGSIIPKIPDYEKTPSGAVEYIKEHEEDLSGLKIYTTYNNGSYFLWNNVGRTYLEPKGEIYLRKLNHRFDVITEAEYIEHYADPVYLEYFVEHYDFDYIMVDIKNTVLENYLKTRSDYEMVYHSDRDSLGQFTKELGVIRYEYALYRHIKGE